MCNLPRLRARPATKAIAFALAGSFLAFWGVPRSAAQADQDEGPPKVTAIRFWSLGDVTRIAIEATAEFQFRSDRLENPERIFFDIVGAKSKLSKRGQTVIEVGDRFLQQIRVAETQRGTTRVVLDLARAVEFSTSQLSNPDRLIIELHPVQELHPLQPTQSSVRERPEMPVLTGVPNAPRSMNLAFALNENRRALERRAMTAPVLPNPPSPYDPGQRFATRPYWKNDPVAALGLTWMGPLPPPFRLIRSTHVSSPSLSPGVLAKAAPISIPSSQDSRMPEIPSPPSAPLRLSPKPAPAAVSAAIGLPAKRTPGGDTMIRVLGLKLGRIVIDPGHGGHDTGTIGPDGLREKDIALDVSKRLGTLIQDRLGSEVVFTRTDDTFIPLSRRTDIANELRADLFLSIHVNSSPVRAASGVETYYLSFTTSRAALETASRENAGADRNVGELQDLLKKIVLKDKVDESREFASRIQSSLSNLDQRSTPRSGRDRGIKRAPFVVLIGASMPSVLAEVGFITNAREENLMHKPDYRQRIAEALYKGVAAYSNSLSHFQVAQQSDKIVKSEAALR